MDFGKPTTPGDAVRYVKEGVYERAKALRRNAQVLVAQAEALESAWAEMEGTAQSFDRYQPDPQPVCEDPGAHS